MAGAGLVQSVFLPEKQFNTQFLLQGHDLLRHGNL